MVWNRWTIQPACMLLPLVHMSLCPTHLRDTMSSLSCVVVDSPNFESKSNVKSSVFGSELSPSLKKIQIQSKLIPLLSQAQVKSNPNDTAVSF